MPRNAIWLWVGYDADGRLIGELVGSNAEHALEEFSHMYPDDDVVRVARIEGTGQPNITPEPMPGTARYLVRYIGPDGKRHKVKVRTVSIELAKQLLDHKGRVTSAKVIGA